ncbi:MAG: branched-chain amino acid transport system permease protein [Gaiellaceae bacterium]|nr:branched-chain amino acid transport system permease protein [Gaiellaceae bacterium]
MEERPDTPRIGVDEWVANVEGKRERYTGWRGAVLQRWERLPVAARVLVFALPAAVFPFLTSQGNVFRYGLFTLVYALLALGLNIVVGFAGLLDLGYVAVFGCGAYMYAILASPQFGYHWQAEAAIPVVIIVTALIGLLVGLPSRRLLGDYLAILTLFFGQAFVIFVNNANRISFPFVGHTDLTGGSNGIANIDPFNFFGFKLDTTMKQYYLLLISVALVLVLLAFVNESRTGRAWRALREDPLAAEVMSIPVNRLKLSAFVFGAAVAGFTGAIYGTIATAALPGDYDVGLLITIYAIMILGGFGSIMGIVVGAIIVSSVPELLRSSANARPLFYGAILLAILVKIRPWRLLAAQLGGLIAFGFAVHAIAAAAYPRLVHGQSIGSGGFTRFLDHWMLFPKDAVKIADVAYILMIAAIVMYPQLSRLWRAVLLPPLLYLVMFVWENLLLVHISGATRLVLLGAMLVALMNIRPQGLFGTATVEIV